MYCNAITMRLLVGRLTPAIRAKSVTPRGEVPTDHPWGSAALCRSQYHLRKGHKHKKPAPACRWGLASLLNLRLDIPGLLRDSLRFRQPRLAISCITGLSGAG